jgi:hypothetical protein
MESSDDRAVLHHVRVVRAEPVLIFPTGATMSDPDKLFRDVEKLRKRASREHKPRGGRRGGESTARERLKPILIASGAALIAAVAGAIKTGLLHHGETREATAL